MSQTQRDTLSHLTVACSQLEYGQRAVHHHHRTRRLRVRAHPRRRLRKEVGQSTLFIHPLSTPHSIGQARFLKTVKCRHRNGPLVIKIFIKHDPSISLSAYHRKQKRNPLPLPHLRR